MIGSVRTVILVLALQGDELVSKVDNCVITDVDN